MSKTNCELCTFYVFDEECEEYYCDINIDEDEYYSLISSRNKACPYYRNGDDYALVRKQN